MPTKKNSKKAKVSSTDELRKTYLVNRDNMLEDFEACLKEVQRDTPSVPGVIAGMNFQQFSATSVFRFIGDQEDYIKYAEENKLEYVILDEEKTILDDMIKRAKSVFKQDYDSWYTSYAH